MHACPRQTDGLINGQTDKHHGKMAVHINRCRILNQNSCYKKVSQPNNNKSRTVLCGFCAVYMQQSDDNIIFVKLLPSFHLQNDLILSSGTLSLHTHSLTAILLQAT